MNANLDVVKAKARLVLAADRWRELIHVLEKDVPMLIAEVERLHQELTEARRSEGQQRFPTSVVRTPPARDRIESQLLSSKQFAEAIGVTVACVRRWTLMRKINVVKVGRLVRIPRTEVKRLIDEGTIPRRLSGNRP
jgi:excisionase family DNA binding protein